jgi:HSP20 family protein
MAKQESQKPEGREEQQTSQSLEQRQSRGIARQGTLSPFSFMRRLGEEMDRLFSDFGFSPSLTPMLARELGPSIVAATEWEPDIEIFQRGDKLVVRADVPGMEREDVDVAIEDDQLVISGERRSERQEGDEGNFLSERSYGRFCRSVTLPEGVNTETASASFHNGVIEIELAVEAHRARARTLEIKESEGSKSEPLKAEKLESGKAEPPQPGK